VATVAQELASMIIACHENGKDAEAIKEALTSDLARKSLKVRLAHAAK
jgi:hypothetical protein